MIKKILGVLFAAVGVLFIGVALTDHRPVPAAAKAERVETQAEKDWRVDVMAVRAIKASLHDPRSFEVVQVLRMADKSLCVTYRARNGFGALRLSRYVIAPEAGASDAADRFVGLWNRYCGGKTGDDISHIRHVM